MRSRVRNRNRDRGGEPIRLALAVFDSLPKRSGYGISMEKDYLNSAGKRVRWTLEDVETIDLLGTDLADGREVYHEFSEYFARDKLLLPLDLDSSKPTQSGV